MSSKTETSWSSDLTCEPGKKNYGAVADRSDGVVGRKPRRAEDSNNALDGLAPGLSRAVDMASPTIYFKTKTGARPIIDKFRLHAQIRRG
jgi:hypothetical protein